MVIYVLRATGFAARLQHRIASRPGRVRQHRRRAEAVAAQAAARRARLQPRQRRQRQRQRAPQAAPRMRTSVH